VGLRLGAVQLDAAGDLGPQIEVLSVAGPQQHRGDRGGALGLVEGEVDVIARGQVAQKGEGAELSGEGLGDVGPGGRVGEEDRHATRVHEGSALCRPDPRRKQVQSGR
jgi:hypothetical protein